MLKISLGAGTEIEKEKDWVNLDIVKLDGIDIVHDLNNFPWPFKDNSADYIKAKDIIEHMHPGKIIPFIDECYRILITGGVLWIQTPSWQADFLWIDPTHVRGFDKASFDFFDPSTDFGSSTGFYSDSKFLVSAKEMENKNLEFTLIKL